MNALDKLKADRQMQKAVHFHAWYPLLEKAGLKQPKSHIINPSVMSLIHHIALDVETMKEPYKKHLKDLLLEWCSMWLLDAKEWLGFDSLFFKLDTYSDKHNLKKTFVETHRDLYERILDSFNNAALNGVAGNPVSLVFREPLNLKGLALLEDSTLPICVERRAFWKGGKVEKVIPYWPADAFHADEGELEDIKAYLSELDAVAHEAILPEVEKAGKALEALHPNWSIDFALDADGEWWLIDCAPAEMSWGNTPNE
jgi:hypothetical protein